MKLTIVGAGSTYTPELADGLARLKLAVTELVLFDIDAHRLRLVGGVAARILARQGHPVRVTTSTDLDAAVADAAVVLIQLRVGGQRARQSDETFPLDCGCIGQETTGPGGLAKALRTVPVVLGIAERIAALAPAAWIVDFTNPVGIITRALLGAGHRAVGLCNVAIGFQRMFAELRGVRPEEVTLDHVGLNHLTWVRAAYVGGVDVLPDLIEQHAPRIAAKSLPPELIRALGVVPSYYLRYYYEHDAVLDRQRNGRTRAATVSEIERELLEMYADPALDVKPALLAERGGAYYSEAAVQLVSSLIADTGDVQVVNVHNAGTFPWLADDDVVEVPCRVDADGARPLPGAPLHPLYAGLAGHVSNYERLAVDAALHGGRDRVFRALLAHPLTGQPAQAGELADRLIAANRDQLPWAR
jgi:6-phospho-beta-glucosidase